MKPRRLLHRGTVQAVAFWIDESVIGNEIARRRILEMRGVEEVRRLAGGLFVRLLAPAWVAALHAPGVPLVVCRGILLGAPLDPDELDMLAPPADAIVLVRGGEAIVMTLESSAPEDLATWIDLSAWQAEDVKPLGKVLARPLLAPPAKEIDPRKVAGIGPPSPEALAFAEALAKGRQSLATTTKPGFASSLLGSLSAVLSSMAALLGRKPKRVSSNHSQSRALVTRPAAPEPKENWTDKLRMALNTAAAKFLLWAGLASSIGRRQADYLAKTFSMFDSGDLDEALRHAIPLGDGTGKPKPLALGVPTPRTDLSIHTTRGEASSTLGFGGNVFEELRIRYRKAVEQLEKQGRIKEAAFVLAELLGASEEAVSFLEKHHEYQLAAELAEGRNLDPALVVRQWILAGDRDRALLIARRTGAFATAIARLEQSHPHHAEVLRVLWANQLASSGAYAAAVQAIWPVEVARHIARDWIERGIEVGGVPGARLLATKAWLVPEEFDSVASIVRALPRDESEESIATWTALGQSVLANPSSKTMRILARACVRALLPHESDRNTRMLVEKLATAAEDAVLLADIRRQSPSETHVPNVWLWMAALSDVGKARTQNEDGYLMAMVEKSTCTPHANIVQERPLPTRGALLAVADGMGGYGAAEIVDLAFKTLSRSVQSANFSPETIGTNLVRAVEDASAAIYKKATDDRKFYGCGSTITAAWLFGDVLWISQVGDTRAYLYRDEKLTLLTKDHSLINELILQGQLSAEEIEKFEHKSIVTRALGIVERAKVDLYRVRLLDGDRILLCTDGVHGMIDDAAIEASLRDAPHEKRMAVKLMKDAMVIKGKVYDAEAHDNMAMVIADVRIRNARAADSREVIVEQIEVKVEEKPAPTTRIITRAAADIGTIPVYDAAVLPGGRLLVALGEAGVRMLSPEGKTLVQFDQPAQRLVISDHGDRAIAITPRGHSCRTARIDLVRRRAQRWIDATLHEFASNFDGSMWFVSNNEGIYAIDALEENFQSIWDMREPGSCPDMVARSANTASFYSAHEFWTLELPSFRLRARRPVPIEDGHSFINLELAANGTAICTLIHDDTKRRSFAVLHAHETKWSSLGEHDAGDFQSLAIDELGHYGAFCLDTDHNCSLKVCDLRDKRLLLEMHLEAARKVHVRFQAANIVIADASGRVLVIDVAQGKVVNEWRV